MGGKNTPALYGACRDLLDSEHVHHLRCDFLVLTSGACLPAEVPEHPVRCTHASTAAGPGGGGGEGRLGAAS